MLFKRNKTALVLAGGGARGAYHIGVWKALIEMGIKIDIVTGSSVGALTAAMVAQNDFETAHEAFSNIKMSDVLNLPSSITEVGDFVKLLAQKGGGDTTPLKNLLERCVDESKVRSRGIDIGLVTVRRDDIYPIEVTIKDIPKGQLIDYLLASSAIYPVFESPDIGGKKYIDGGFYNNMPIALAEDMGADEIIAVDLESIGIDRQYKGTLPVRYIRPRWPLGSILAFDGEGAKKNIRQGYLDAMKAFKKLEGERYTFQKGALEPLIRKNISKYMDGKLKALSGLASRAIMAELSDNYEAHRNDRRMGVALCEYAADIFELDRNKIYSSAEFRDELMDKYRHSSPLSIKLGLTPSADIDKKNAVVSMVRWLTSDKASTELGLLSSALHREFAAAVFIASLIEPEAIQA